METVSVALERAVLLIARAAIAHPVVALVATLAITGALGTQLPALVSDTSTDGFLEDDDPVRLRYDAFREQFGRDDLVWIALQSPDNFDPSFLRSLGTLHRELEAGVPQLDQVDSLINARSTRGVGDVLVVDDLEEDFPERPSESAGFRDRVLRDPIYPDIFVSRDGRLAALAIQSLPFQSDVAMDGSMAMDGGPASDGGIEAGFDDVDDPFAEPSEEAEGIAEGLPARRVRTSRTAIEDAALVAKVREIVAPYRSDDVEIWIAGAPSLVSRMLLTIQTDLPRFIGLALISIGLLLAGILRRAIAVVLVVGTVAASLISTLGLMAWAGVPISFGTQILPALLLAVGASYATHVLTLFFQSYQRGEAKRAALLSAYAECGPALCMSAITTAIGFASFSFSHVQPLAHLGTFAPLGIALCLAYTLLVLPALVVLLPVRPRAAEESGGRLERSLVRLSEVGMAKARGIVASVGVLFVVMAASASWVELRHDIATWLPEDSDVRTSHYFLDERLNGSLTVELVVDLGRENALHSPASLRNLDALGQYAETGDFAPVYVGKALSIVDVVKEIHQALNAGIPSAYRVPDDEAVVAQELFLFESSGSDDLEDVTDSLFSLARVRIKVLWTDSSYYAPFVQAIEEKARALFPEAKSIYTTGLLAVMTQTEVELGRSVVWSYAFALLLISPLMVALLGWRVGLISLVPNLLPIVMTLGVMGWLGIHLDVFTVMIGTIALGLAVDDTIHMSHGFQRRVNRRMTPVDAIRSTMRTTGRALVITTAILLSGFSIFLTSEMNNLFYFGLLTGLSMVMALAADLVVAPALLVLAGASPTRGEEARGEEAGRDAEAGVSGARVDAGYLSDSYPAAPRPDA